jgi:hypothetical protein
MKQIYTHKGKGESGKRRRGMTLKGEDRGKKKRKEEKTSKRGAHIMAR